ncbi:MAG: hypothetical protein JXA21_06670 [Anaerolineae bacterium]|nr:hypothetical protein [Anaerolineae bacterium]
MSKGKVEEKVEEVAAVEPVAETVAAEAETKADEKKASASKPSSVALKEAWRQVETFGQALGEALQGRGNVVMVRINDEALAHLDMLVEGEITKSRSESAAFLINEGISANNALFARIKDITQQIAELREKLRHDVKLDEE